MKTTTFICDICKKEITGKHNTVYLFRGSDMNDMFLADYTMQRDLCNVCADTIELTLK